MYGLIGIGTWKLYETFVPSILVDSLPMKKPWYYTMPDYDAYELSMKLMSM